MTLRQDFETEILHKELGTDWRLLLDVTEASGGVWVTIQRKDGAESSGRGRTSLHAIRDAIRYVKEAAS